MTTRPAGRASRLAFAVAPVAAAAGIGSLGARTAPQTYARLRKPSWAPPAAAFGPVWSALYVFIGAAGWRLSASGSARARAAHLTQLVLNGAWPVVFFGVRDKRLSLAVIAALDLALAVELADTRRVDPAVALLLAPYASWSAFATALNARVSDPGAS